MAWFLGEAASLLLLLGQVLLWLIAIPVALAVAIALAHVAATRFALWHFRLTHARAGRDLLIVYSESPHWQSYVEREWLPRFGHRAVVLNWSRRRQWSRWAPEVQLFRAFSGWREFNPAVIVVPRRWGGPTIIRFWRAFRDAKHGNDRALQHAEHQLTTAVAAKGRPQSRHRSDAPPT
jgi:hypothetical protein